MCSNRRRPTYLMTVWSLLSLWLLFGGLELAEATHCIQENLSDDGAENEDLEALAQLASGLKSELPAVIDPSFLSIATNTFDPSTSGAGIVFMPHRLQWLSVHGPPTLSLHQQISVYRI
jgi:hypothetical protein